MLFDMCGELRHLSYSSGIGEMHSLKGQYSTGAQLVALLDFMLTLERMGYMC